MNREVPALTIDLAQVRFERSEYAAAHALLLQALGDGTTKDSAKARIHLGLVHTRLGQFKAAQDDLRQALQDVQKREDVGYRPLLLMAMGELAYQSGSEATAREYFVDSAALWTDDLPEPA